MKRIFTSLWLAACAGAVFAADGVNVPPSGTNVISGTVRFTNADAAILARLGPPGNAGISSFSVFASAGSLTSSKNFTTADPLSHPYALTVAVDGTPRTYSVGAYLALDSDRKEYWMAPLDAAPLTSNSPPATVDLEECVALLEIRYVDEAGAPVAAAGGYALASETATSIYRARYLTNAPGLTGSFLAVPSGVALTIMVDVHMGDDIYANRRTIREKFTGTYACDEQPVITITIPTVSALGQIKGDANLVGEIELATEGYQELLGRPVVKASGPAGNQRYAALMAEAPGPDSARPFVLEKLVPSTATEKWNVWTEMHFGAGHHFEYFRSPGLGEGEHNPGVTVAGGAMENVGNTFVMDPARLVGRITLTGPPELPGQPSALRNVVRASDYDADMDGIPDAIGATTMNGSHVVMYGVDTLAPGATRTTAGGNAAVSFAGGYEAASSAFAGDYVAVLGMLNDQPGVWKQDGIAVRFYDAGTNGGPLVDAGFYVSEATPWQGTLEAGGRATNDLHYDLAEVCVRIRSPAPFYYPRIINSLGGLTNASRAYSAQILNASAPPYFAHLATNEAVITFLVPAGNYTLNPVISVPDADGGVSEVQLPTHDISVAGGDRYCVDECIRIVIEPPMCSTNFGFIGWGNAVSTCGETLTNLSVTIRPLSNPSVRLGYTERWLLMGNVTNEMRLPGQVFPEFDGFLPAHPEYYENMVWTVIARDNLGHEARREAVFRFDFTPPTVVCPGDTNVVTDDPIGAFVTFPFMAEPSRAGALYRVGCVPPSGSLFPVGVTTVRCTAVDLCRNTNACSFNVTVGPSSGDCELRIAREPSSQVTLTWDCPGTLQWAPDLTGPWTSLTGATSPHNVTASETGRFYRVCVSGGCGP